MSKERELLKRWLIDFGKIHPSVELMKETQNLLAQPEPEGVYQKLLRIEDGIEVEILPSELWQDGYETGKRTMQPKQEPVAWLHEWVDETGETVRSIYSHFYEHSNLIPLYTSPPTRKPLTNEEIFEIGYKAGFAIDQDESADYESDAYGFLNEDGYVDNEPYFKLVRAIEKAHGIGQ